jgi:hypothetical protein
MGMIGKTTKLTLLAAFYMHRAAAGEVATEVQPWPVEQACAACVTLQFGVLEMRLPSAMIGKIFIAPGGDGGLHLLPADADIRHSLYFRSAPSYNWAQRYYQLIPPLDAQQFLDQLGTPAAEGSPWRLIRKVEQLDGAERYIKANKGKLHAYWVRAKPPNTQYLHITVDGHDRSYSVNGDLTPALYAALLANLRAAPEP